MLCTLTLTLLLLSPTGITGVGCVAISGLCPRWCRATPWRFLARVWLGALCTWCGCQHSVLPWRVWLWNPRFLLVCRLHSRTALTIRWYSCVHVCIVSTPTMCLEMCMVCSYCIGLMGTCTAWLFHGFAGSCFWMRLTMPLLVVTLEWPRPLGSFLHMCFGLTCFSQ